MASLTPISGKIIGKYSSLAQVVDEVTIVSKNLSAMAQMVFENVEKGNIEKTFAATQLATSTNVLTKIKIKVKRSDDLTPEEKENALKGIDAQRRKIIDVSNQILKPAPTKSAFQVMRESLSVEFLTNCAVSAILMGACAKGVREMNFQKVKDDVPESSSSSERTIDLTEEKSPLENIFSSLRHRFSPRNTSLIKLSAYDVEVDVHRIEKDIEDAINRSIWGDDVMDFIEAHPEDFPDGRPPA